MLAAGLGNPAMTPDALGPRMLDHLLVTRHLGELPELVGLCGQVGADCQHKLGPPVSPGTKSGVFPIFLPAAEKYVKKSGEN